MFALNQGIVIIEDICFVVFEIVNFISETITESSDSMYFENMKTTLLETYQDKDYINSLVTENKEDQQIIKEFYIAEMSKNGAYGDNMIITIFQTYTNINVVIFNDSEGDVNSIRIL
jgi:hypothetical protein